MHPKVSPDQSINESIQLASTRSLGLRKETGVDPIESHETTSDLQTPECGTGRHAAAKPASRPEAPLHATYPPQSAPSRGYPYGYPQFHNHHHQQQPLPPHQYRRQPPQATGPAYPAQHENEYDNPHQRHPQSSYGAAYHHHYGGSSHQPVHNLHCAHGHHQLQHLQSQSGHPVSQYHHQHPVPQHHVPSRPSTAASTQGPSSAVSHYSPPPPPSATFVAELTRPDSDTDCELMGTVMFELGDRWVRKLELWLCAHPKSRPSAPCPVASKYSTVEMWLQKLNIWYEANFLARSIGAQRQGRGRGRHPGKGRRTSDDSAPQSEAPRPSSSE